MMNIQYAIKNDSFLFFVLYAGAEQQLKSLRGSNPGQIRVSNMEYAAIGYSVLGGIVLMGFLGVLVHFATKAHDDGVRYTESGRAFKVDKNENTFN